LHAAAAAESECLQACWEGLPGRLQRFDFRPGVQAGDIGEVNGTIIKTPAPSRRSIGNSLHFFQVLLLEAAKEQCVNQLPRIIPAVSRRIGALHGRKTFQVTRDLRGHQVAVLIASIVRLAFNVKHHPTGLWIPISRTVSLHGLGIGREIRLVTSSDRWRDQANTNNERKD